MKIKHYFLACTVLLAGLTSCNKSDDGVDINNDGEKDLYIKIERPTSKADTGSLEDGTPVSFSEGALYFTNATGRILRYIRITNEASIAGTLTPGQLEAGVTIEKVHQDATHVHLYGNYSPENTYENLSQIPAVNYDSQMDSDFGVSKANLYGSATIAKTSDDKYEATIYVAAVLARLEVEQLQAKDDADEDDGIGIKSFTLRGIYINNYYMEVTPNGNPNGTAVYHGQDYEKYYRAGISTYPDGQARPNAINGQYAAKYLGYLFDDAPSVSQTPTPIGTSADRKLAPVNDAWAYNVFAVSTSNPHIVFHFTDIIFNDSSDTPRENLTTGVDGEAYLTVTGYTSTGSGGFVNVEGGSIYQMENVLFGKDDLGDVPEKNEKKDVKVTVKLMPWKVVPVNPSFE